MALKGFGYDHLILNVEWAKYVDILFFVILPLQGYLYRPLDSKMGMTGEGDKIFSSRRLHISHNMPCLPTNILHNLCF